MFFNKSIFRKVQASSHWKWIEIHWSRMPNHALLQPWQKIWKEWIRNVRFWVTSSDFCQVCLLWNMSQSLNYICRNHTSWYLQLLRKVMQFNVYWIYKTTFALDFKNIFLKLFLRAKSAQMLSNLAARASKDNCEGCKCDRKRRVVQFLRTPPTLIGKLSILV